MSKSIKHPNPYREGCAYNSIFAYWKKNQVVTEQELVEAGFKLSDVRVVLSPRESSTRGDCRGNASSQGHLYYADQLNRKKVDGVKEAQRERLRWRPEPMEPRKRGEKLGVKGQKVEETVEEKSPVTEAEVTETAETTESVTS